MPNENYDQNRRTKEDLIREAESLSSAVDLKAAKRRHQELRDRWREVGPTGAVGRELSQRFRAAGDHLYEAASREWREKQWKYVEQVEARIREHETVIARLESTRGELMNRQRNVKPGNRELELISHYDRRIHELDDAILQRKQWLSEDVHKARDARGRLSS
jgi:hypothetical protein